jgi:hypothetical protein
MENVQNLIMAIKASVALDMTERNRVRNETGSTGNAMGKIGNIWYVCDLSTECVIQH